MPIRVTLVVCLIVRSLSLVILVPKKKAFIVRRYSLGKISFFCNGSGSASQGIEFFRLKYSQPRSDFYILAQGDWFIHVLRLL